MLRFDKMARATALILALLLFPMVYCWGYGFYDVGWGSQNAGLTARSLAMGGIGINSESGGSAVFVNPAQLAKADGLNVSLDYRLTYAREDWSYPAHDSFDGFLVDNIYSQSAVVYPDFGFSLGYKPKFGEYAPAFGIGYYPLRDFRYNYQEEVREPSYAQPADRDSLISINSVRNSGKYYYIGLGAGWELNRNLLVGASYNYAPAVGGSERKFYADVLHVDTSVADTGSRSIIDPDASGYILVGFNVRPDDRFEFGFTYQSEHTAEATYQTRNIPLTFYQEGKFEEVNPVSLGAAFSYRPRSATFSRLEAEFHYTYWSNYRLRDKGTATTYGADTTSASVDTTYLDNLQDSWEVRVGVEHRFYSNIPARFGFRMYPNPDNRRVFATVVSVGTGFMIDQIQVDLGGALTTRVSRQRSWFGNANLWDAEINRLKESHLSGTVSVSYRFGI